MAGPGPESAILITEDHLDRRVDFEKGMRVAPRVTIVLILLQAACFAMEVARGALDDAGILVALGAQEAAAARSGEWWRLWSATMLHGSVDHFIGNALAFYIAGMACEHAFGVRAFVFLYLVSAVAGSLLSLTGLPPGVPAVGASGAIFGLMGAIVATMFRHRDRLYVRDKRVGWVILCWAGYTIVMGLLTPFVDNLAHIGGFIAGAGLGWLLRPAVLSPGASGIDWVLGGVGVMGMVLLSAPWVMRLA